MNDNTLSAQSGERLSFYKLFFEKGYRLMIPIIQRDYAQGRETSKEVRENFLQALYDYLDDNKPNRDLDFVYGSLTNNTERKTTDFTPLDGQQRLTTLFLLHWYLAQISGNMTKLRSVLFNENKSKFGYETRSSSEEFCDALMGNDIDFKKLLPSDKDKENCLSKTITNSAWYYLSWKYDLTIQSMLTMLDAIHKKFVNNPEFYERLTDKEKPIITFLFLNLKEFKLTDDLYIKMNSRGKPLTPFENFKAKFEQYIETIKYDRIFTIKFGNTTKDVSLKEYFSFKIDTEWANLFWNYRTSQNRDGDNTFDDELMNFIRVIFSSQYAIEHDTDAKLEYLIGTQIAKRNQSYTDVISFHKYEELNALTEPAVFYLINSFDKLENGNERIKIYLSESYKYYFDENTIFENALRHNFSNMQERVCFHAYLKYLIHYNTNISGIDQWMRVIHNLANNTIIDGADEVAKAIKSIEKLLPSSNTIIDYLKKDSNKIDFFLGVQVTEEKIKAHLINKTTNDWKNQIENVERISWFEGQIGFILEFSGILDYYNNHKNCDFNMNDEKKFFDSFVNYSNKAIAVFNNDIMDFSWERSALTKGDYLIDTSSWRKNFLSTDSNARDFSWKRLLRITSKEDPAWDSRRSYVKQVFDDPRLRIDSAESINKSLESICKDKTNDWRDYFINEPNLIKYCKQGFIQYYKDDKHILLYNASQSNHLHAEMYSYFLFKQYLEGENLPPFKAIWYNPVKGSEDNACVVLNDYCHDRKYYEIRVYYCADDNLPNPYEIKFSKSKGENKPEAYGDDIKKLLINNEFEWQEEYSGYYYTFTSHKKIIDKVLLLCKSLNDL
ncbi:MAG: DUF262 domain-containing protein [Bacteroidales bacterium]|jgi:hypothetical protein|nr:DUF262 domain-containing protein [Bacteroidales bacterium]